MNKFHKILTITSLTFLLTSGLFAHEQQAQLFNAENGITGNYWADNKTAIVEEDEYINVIAIKKSQLNKKYNKKLRKNKNYLGLYIDEKSGQKYCLYGNLKNPAKIDDSPDAEVITEIAIKEDYGPGE
jgi:hypothetical protein